MSKAVEDLAVEEEEIEEEVEVEVSDYMNKYSLNVNTVLGGFGGGDRGGFGGRGRGGGDRGRGGGFGGRG